MHQKGLLHHYNCTNPTFLEVKKVAFLHHPFLGAFEKYILLIIFCISWTILVKVLRNFLAEKNVQ
jgi:hypothetical protein